MLILCPPLEYQTARRRGANNIENDMTNIRKLLMTNTGTNRVITHGI